MSPSPRVLMFALLAAGGGGCLALQAAVNTRFRAQLGSPLSAVFFSICGTFLCAGLVMTAARPAAPAADAVRGTAWWQWCGGPLGALVVLAGATLPRELGAAAFLALVVAGQLACGLLLDHFALVGLPHSPLTWPRGVGAALVVAGVVCIKFL